MGPIIAVLIVLGFAFGLSVSAFYGGFHYAYWRFLKKMKPLNDIIVSLQSENIETLKTLNDFLIAISAENETVTFMDWYRQTFTGDKSDL